MMRLRWTVTVSCLAALAACGDTRLERTGTGAGIGAGIAALASASIPVGAVLGAGAGYFTR
jgi:hypothetical protein